MNAERYKPLREYVEIEIASVWTRKTSFETRALATVTLNLTFITLYFALLKQPVFDGYLALGHFNHIQLTALAFSVSSITFSAACIFPTRYDVPGKNRLDQMLVEAKSDISIDHEVEILENRISQLEKYSDKTQIKGVLVGLSSISFALCVAIFLVSLFLAALPN